MMTGSEELMGGSTDGISGSGSGSAAGEASASKEAAGISDKNDTSTPAIPVSACEVAEDDRQLAITKIPAWSTSE
jgi:hypothetical protein